MIILRFFSRNVDEVALFSWRFKTSELHYILVSIGWSFICITFATHYLDVKRNGRFPYGAEVQQTLQRPPTCSVQIWP